MQQLNKPTYSEQVVNLIRQRIRNGKLRSGDRISEASIAEECGISRAPVREALYQLETEGFLMSHPKRGKCVTLLTGDGIRHRYEHAALGTAFHETILERASNPLLIAIARSSCRVISKYLMFQQWRTLYTTEELFQRHNSMYEAFLTRNPYTIEEAVRAHYADSAERLAQICEAEQKPKTARSQRRAHFPTE